MINGTIATGALWWQAGQWTHHQPQGVRICCSVGMKETTQER
jgi:hypothetical protein